MGSSSTLGLQALSVPRFAAGCREYITPKSSCSLGRGGDLDAPPGSTGSSPHGFLPLLRLSLGRWAALLEGHLEFAASSAVRMRSGGSWGHPPWVWNSGLWASLHTGGTNWEPLHLSEPVSSSVTGGDSSHPRDGHWDLVRKGLA